MKKIIQTLFCLALTSSVISGCASGDKVTITEPSKSPEIKIPKTDISQNNVGYILIDKESGEVLDQQNIDQTFIPASSVKIITAYAALATLGEDYQFKTSLKLDKNWKLKIQNKVYFGNVYLDGDFDPVLSISDITNMVIKLRKAGITQIKGNFLYKISDIDFLTEINKNQPALAAYNSAIGTLNISRPDNAKNSVRVNDVLDTKTYGFYAIKQPTTYVAELFQRIATLNGIKINTPQSYNPNKISFDNEILFTHKSPPLVEITELMLNQSINEIAEIMAFKTAQNIAPTRNIDSLPEAQEIITNWLKSRININWTGYYFQNGSGLSSTSRVTPNQFMSILKTAMDEDLGDKSFITLLPISGWSGTLNSRLSDSEGNLRVYAKTGTVNYGNALVGSLFSKSNRELLFVILVSDVNKKGLIDSKNNLSGEDTGNAGSWTKKARSLQDQMIKKWVREN